MQCTKSSWKCKSIIAWRWKLVIVGASRTSPAGDFVVGNQRHGIPAARLDQHWLACLGHLILQPRQVLLRLAI